MLQKGKRKRGRLPALLHPQPSGLRAKGMCLQRALGGRELCKEADDEGFVCSRMGSQGYSEKPWSQP